MSLEESSIFVEDILKNIKGKFILTINDYPEVREWYQGFEFLETEVMYSVEKEGKRKFRELIIKNY
ncbi:hypothetical protein [Alkaliphilus transvaalensis]|uniref:hypothetical protein n=1 Tax=Alkaliphilus transvaalensis TaxID=114628 RepID=UPI00047A0F85|nr:hypothetical protein [Alkaliphilus transvaalensis]